MIDALNLATVPGPKGELAARLRTVRVARYGDDLAGMARRLGVPAATWRNYEAGVTIPGEVLLRFIEVTGARPAWLLDGAGPRFEGPDAATSTPSP